MSIERTPDGIFFTSDDEPYFTEEDALRVSPITCAVANASLAYTEMRNACGFDSAYTHDKLEKLLTETRRLEAATKGSSLRR